MQDASTILARNLAPMLEGISAYGNRIARERDVANERLYKRELVEDERRYQDVVRKEDRDYQRGVRKEDREYLESLKLRDEDRQRKARFEDEAKARRVTNTRLIQQAFPGEPVEGKSDAQIESRASEAQQQINRRDIFAKNESEIRSEAQRMGIQTALTANVDQLRSLIVNAKNEEVVKAEQGKLKAIEEYEAGRLASNEGQAALNQYKGLAAQKSRLLRDFIDTSMRGQGNPNPQIDADVGARTIEFLQSQSPDIYEVLNRPGIREATLAQIIAGRNPDPSAIRDPNVIASLASAAQQARSAVMREYAAQGRIDAMTARSDSYIKFQSNDMAVRQLDAEMARLSSAFPALRKVPGMNMDEFVSPSAGPIGSDSVRESSTPKPPPPSSFTTSTPTLPFFAPASSDLNQSGRANQASMPPIGYTTRRPDGQPETSDPLLQRQLDAIRMAAGSGAYDGVDQQFLYRGKSLIDMSRRLGGDYSGARDALAYPWANSVADLTGIEPTPVGSSSLYRTPVGRVASANWDQDMQYAWDNLSPEQKAATYMRAINAISGLSNRDVSAFANQARKAPTWTLGR